MAKGDAKYHIIYSAEEILCDKYLCFDFEMGSDNGKITPAYLWYKQEVYFLCIAIKTEYNYYILFLTGNDVYGRYGRDGVKPASLKALKKLFEDKTIIKVGHNVKFDIHCLYKLFDGDINLDLDTFYDTMLMGYMIDNTIKKSLENYGGHYFNYDMSYKDTMTYSYQDKMHVVAKYVFRDIYVTDRLYKHFCNFKDFDWKYYDTYYKKCLKTLVEAEEIGMKVDLKFIDNTVIKLNQTIAVLATELRNNPVIKKYEVDYENYLVNQKIFDIQTKIKAYVDKGKANYKQVAKYKEALIELRKNKTLNGKFVFQKINFDSPKQMVDILFDGCSFPTCKCESKQKCQFPVGFNIEVPEGFKRSSDEGTLKQIEYIHNDDEYLMSFINKVNIYRSLSKLLSTYYLGLKDIQQDSYVHCSFNLVGTGTGRLSASDPNLQNQTKHVKHKEIEYFIKGVRKIFVAPTGYSLCSFDLSQAELRMIANFSLDEAMIDAYQKGLDLHTQTTGNIFDISYDQLVKMKVTNYDEYDRMRSIGKAANFALVYKISVKGYMAYIFRSTGLKITEKEAKKHIKAFYSLYTRLPVWHKTYIKLAEKYGYVKTFFGRKVKILDINHHEYKLKSSAERNAVNYHIQGSIGEITMFTSALAMEQVSPDTYFVNNVHDANMFYIHDKLLKTEIPIIKNVMENTDYNKYFKTSCDLIVPLKADVEVGKTWLYE